ncbi:MAG: hypothetical protein ACQESR_18960 [Planctomycetota bacterium]
MPSVLLFCWALHPARVGIGAGFSSGRRPRAAQSRSPTVIVQAGPNSENSSIFQAVRFLRVERCPTQAVLPLVGLAAEQVIRDPYITSIHSWTLDVSDSMRLVSISSIAFSAMIRMVGSSL